ncbi:MAG: hypothetical protein FWH35_02320 [Treponema sp.]|nr:hypothetical protein [Treponema sp.]
MKDRIKVKGMVTVRVFDKEGNIKRCKPGFFRRVFGLQGRMMICKYHNIVTREGDALIADALLVSPTRTKVCKRQSNHTHAIIKKRIKLQ